MERTHKPWVSPPPTQTAASGSTSPFSQKSNSYDRAERNLRDVMLHSLEIPSYKRNPQRDANMIRYATATPRTDMLRARGPDRPLSTPEFAAARRPGLASHHSQDPSTSNGVRLSASKTSSATDTPSHHLPRLTSAPEVPGVTTIEDALPPPPSYEETELTIFLDRIQRDPTAATYENLLLLAEVNGEVPGSSSGRQRASNDQPLRASTGPIELVSRRTTKDGKTKLKLALAGVRVDKCGICLSQFKTGEQGALTDCSHSFHESCLQKWLARTAVCPTCRASLALA